MERYGEHPWIGVWRKSAAASHPHGLEPGNRMVNDAIDRARGKPYAGQPDWIRGVYRAFGQ